MWRLSDEILKDFEEMLEESYRQVKKLSESLSCRWKELPEAKISTAAGVDGSRGAEKFSGVVFYAVSAVAVGEDVLELHEVTMLKPYRYIDDRIRLHMQINEFRVGSVAREDLVLMDGTLSGAIIRPPAYISEDMRDKLGTLRLLYDLDEMIEDFVTVLDEWCESIEEDVVRGVARKNYLLSRSDIFNRMERGYRRGEESRKEDVTILFEYIEYLHALNRLLEKDVVFVAKSFYTSEFSKNASVSDSALLDYLARAQFGEEKAAYLTFKQRVSKSIPFLRHFQNIEKADVNAAFVRFADHGNIYLVESTREVDDELISKLLGFEVGGYLLPLIHAHRYAEIKRKELKSLIQSLVNAVDPKYSFLLKRGRDAIEHI